MLDPLLLCCGFSVLSNHEMNMLSLWLFVWVRFASFVHLALLCVHNLPEKVGWGFPDYYIGVRVRIHVQ